jgi:hypothetical protein
MACAFSNFARVDGDKRLHKPDNLAVCRSIKKLRNIEPATTPEDVQAAALQFVRKVSGYRVPAKKNEEAFNGAVDAVTRATLDLLDQIEPARSGS